MKNKILSTYNDIYIHNKCRGQFDAIFVSDYKNCNVIIFDNQQFIDENNEIIALNWKLPKMSISLVDAVYSNKNGLICIGSKGHLAQTNARQLLFNNM